MRPFLSITMACAMTWGLPARAQVSQPGPSFHEAVVMAWAIDPVRTELQVGHHSARARASAAGSWFAGGPTLSGEYMDDHMIGSNEGYTTYQGGVSVPLWLPGQGSATKQVASAEAASIDEQLNVEHMALSIRVLDAAAAALIARTRVDVAHASYDAAARMAISATHAVHGGELASADGQLAQAAMENARNELALAQEEAENAAAALEVLLGRPVVPDLTRYGGSDVTQARFVSPRDMEDNDPRIKVAHRNVEAAEANMKLARHSFMPNPEIGVDAIHEKQYGSPIQFHDRRQRPVRGMGWRAGQAQNEQGRGEPLHGTIPVAISMRMLATCHSTSARALASRVLAAVCRAASAVSRLASPSRQARSCASARFSMFSAAVRVACRAVVAAIRRSRTRIISRCTMRRACVS